MPLIGLKKNKSNVHLMGLISDGGVHADVDHLLALLDMAHRQDFDKVFIDAITDGTDSGPTQSLHFVDNINHKIDSLKIGQFSSVGGRSIAMDRDEHWDRIRKYYECLTTNKGLVFDKIESAISENYRHSKTDEYIEPALIKGKDGKTHPIKDGDAVIFFNFREDRAMQLADVFLNKNFHKFLWHPQKIKDLYFATFINYKKDLPAKVVFKGDQYPNNLSQYLADLNCTQLKIAESEKASHVGTFFNGGQDVVYKNEERKIVSSPDVASYDLKPEMSAKQVASATISAIGSNKYDFICVNFANVDMLAHTGNIIAVGQAVVLLDKLVGEIVNTCLKNGGATIITADHGNAEQMVSINQSVLGERESVHTLNPVPFILITPDNKKDLIKTTLSFGPNALEKIIYAKDSLASVAPTILELMALPKPKEMTNHSLILTLE